MEQNVIKFLFFYFIVGTFSVCGQNSINMVLNSPYSKAPTSSFAYFSDLKMKGKEHSYYALESDLAKNVPVPSDLECRFDVEFFIFRINQKGKIDYYKSYGNLLDTVRSQIKKNIYATQGHYYLNKKSKEKFHWFIYPFFSDGMNLKKKCSTGKTFNEAQAFRSYLSLLWSTTYTYVPTNKSLTVLFGGNHNHEIDQSLLEGPLGIDFKL